jgi:hypothetical protein
MNSNRHLRIENPHQNRKFWHKVQVHCHSSESDAKRGQTPKAVEEAYRDAGYDCVFLTDHNRITPGPGVPGILHIDSSEHGVGRHHTLALGIDRAASDQHHPDDPEAGSRIFDENEDGIQATVGCACRNIPKRLAHITGVQRAIPIAAHPNARHFCSRVICPRLCGGGWSAREMLGYSRHYAGLEIFNANNAVRRMWSLNRWDEVLASASRGIWGFASDDCHDVHDERTFDRGWIRVNSEIDPRDCRRGLVNQDTWRQNMLQNIRGGNFCAVIRLDKRRLKGQTTPAAQDGGPSLVISCGQGQIHVAADRPCETIEFCAGSSSHRESLAASGSADFAYDVSEWEEYVRVRVLQKRDDGQHHIVFSQPLFVRRDEPS